MKKNVIMFFVFGLLGLILMAGERTYQWEGWTFKLTYASSDSCAREMETFEILKRLITKYDLFPWIRTKEIHIQDGVASHSNPLTINTRKNHDPHSLLATFLHEQIHRLEEEYRTDFHHAMAEIEVLFPRLPEELSDDKTAAYRHFVVNYFEIMALQKLLGEKEALAVIRKKDKNKWIYRTILDNKHKLKIVYRKYKLDKRIYVK